MAFASAFQIVIFTQGHLYQGWIRLIPVVRIGTLLTLSHCGENADARNDCPWAQR